MSGIQERKNRNSSEVIKQKQSFIKVNNINVYISIYSSFSVSFVVVVVAIIIIINNNII